MTTFLPLDVDAAGQQRREADRAAGLDHQFQFAKGKSDRGADFGVGGGDALREQLAVDGEGDLAGHRGHQRIADGAALGAVRLAFAGAQRARVIVELFGFAGHHHAPADSAP